MLTVRINKLWVLLFNINSKSDFVPVSTFNTRIRSVQLTTPLILKTMLTSIV
jgi:hypothetical protein